VVSGQIEGWVPSLGVHGVTVPAEMERAIMRALERDPELRQASADEFLEGLGDENQPGDILGGRFVDRQNEVRQLKEFWLSEAVGSPTLIHVCGPHGIGKTAVLSELGIRETSSATKYIQLSEPERQLAEIAHLGSTPHDIPIGVSSEKQLSAIADGLISQFAGESVLFVDDSASPDSLVRDLARYVWAEAAERNVPPTIRFARTSSVPPQNAEPFEQSLTLDPFETPQALELVSGILGMVEISREFVQRLTDETGGIPQALAVATLELVDRQLITRRFGIWQAQDPTDAQWHSLNVGSSRWARSWSRLDDDEKRLLGAVGLVREGTSVADLQALFPQVDVEGAVSRLQAFGWIVARDQKLHISSREAERVVLDSGPDLDEVGIRILDVLDGVLGRADRAALLMRGPATEEAVQEGLWLGKELQGERRHRESIGTFVKTREIARELRDDNAAKTASLRAAAGLHRSGENEEVLSILTDPRDWSELNGNQHLVAERSRLLGLSYAAKGDLGKAKESLAACSAAATQAGDVRLWLQAEAELSEVEWRHGGEAGRAAAAKRIEGLPVERLEQFPDEWAALKYQLGASLIVGGKRREAIRVLDDALNLAQSNYWSMRIGNALAAAHYYLGNFRSGLDAADLAWQHAVDGEVDSFKPRILASMGGLRYGVGMFREAADQDRMAAFWGRRMGNSFEHEAGLLAAASDFIQLAEFEQAIAFASDARSVAMAADHHRHVSKSLEMEALALLHIGDYAAARDRLDKARLSLEGRGYDDLVPRLYWHEAKIEMENGSFALAEARLFDALQVLEKTRDWEDLPGVQIEMQLLFARSGDKRLNLEELRGLLLDARSREIGLVQLRATLALGEIAVIVPEQPEAVLEILMEGLRLAERAGGNEFVWRLSYWIARLLRETGDLRGATARISNAIRVIRGIASQLTPGHRSFYLDTVHARLLLSEAALTTG
jgi:tetratricopeptide (TPR) repeat protein